MKKEKNESSKKELKNQENAQKDGSSPIEEKENSSSPSETHHVLLPSFQTLLTESWDLYKKHWKMIILITIPMIIQNLSNVFFLFYAQSLVSLIFSALLITICSLSLLCVFVSEETLTVQAVFKKTLNIFPGYFRLILFHGFLLMLGFFCFIIPGVFLSIAFSFASYIFLLEGVKGFDALLKSKAYIKGCWWEVFKKNIFFVSFYTFSLFLQIFLSYTVGDKELLKDYQLIYVIISSLLIAPIITLFNLLIYKAIKQTKDLSNFVASEKEKQKLSFGLGIFSIPCFIVMIYFGGIMLFKLNLIPSKYIENSPDIDISVEDDGIPNISDKEAIIKYFENALAIHVQQNGYYPPTLQRINKEYFYGSPPTDAMLSDPAIKYTLDRSDHYTLCIVREGQPENCVTPIPKP